MIGLVLLATIKNAYLLGNSWMWNQIETVWSGGQNLNYQFAKCFKNFY